MNIEDRNESDTLFDSPTHSNAKKVTKKKKLRLNLFFEDFFNPKSYQNM